MNSQLSFSITIIMIITIWCISGVNSYIINLQDEQVIVESILPTGEIHKLLEDTGRKAIFRGQGTQAGWSFSPFSRRMNLFGSEFGFWVVLNVWLFNNILVGSPQHLGAAVSIMSGEMDLQGIIRFVQVRLNFSTCTFWKQALQNTV